MPSPKLPTPGVIVQRSVIIMFAWWAAITSIDLVYCRVHGAVCNEQRSELKSAITTATGTLLGWLTKSPLDGG